MTMPPKMTFPKYECKLISNGKTISFRPFLVKEEKLQLMAAASKDKNEIKNAIEQIVGNCVLDDNFDVAKASTFDVEWIMINLRIHSVGDRIEVPYTCKNIPTGKTEICDTPFKINYTLSEVEIIKDESLNAKIWLDDNLGVMMRPPRFSIAEKEDPTFAYSVLADSVAQIFTKKNEDVYTFEESSEAEITDWFESLTKEAFTKLVDYLSRLPRFEVNKTHVCESCGFEHKIKVDNLSSFF